MISPLEGSGYGEWWAGRDLNPQGSSGAGSCPVIYVRKSPSREGAVWIHLVSDLASSSNRVRFEPMNFESNLSNEIAMSPRGPANN